MPSTNICLYCGEAFSGRPTQKFCSETHQKAYHDTRREGPHPDPNVYYAEDEGLTREEIEEAAEERAEKARQLHQRYSTWLGKALKANGTAQDEDELEAWVENLDEVTEAYRTHPALRQAPNRVHARLADLYWLRDEFQRLLAESRTQASGWFRAPEPLFFELSVKRLTKLRAHLVG